jgi:hypothetical protein
MQHRGRHLLHNVNSPLHVLFQAGQLSDVTSIILVLHIREKLKV